MTRYSNSDTRYEFFCKFHSFALVFVPVLFQMSLCYIISCTWVIYVCPCAITNDLVLYYILYLGHICLSLCYYKGPCAILYIVPGSYVFVPGLSIYVPMLFQMTLCY